MLRLLSLLLFCLYVLFSTEVVVERLSFIGLFGRRKGAGNRGSWARTLAAAATDDRLTCLKQEILGSPVIDGMPDLLKLWTVNTTAVQIAEALGSDTLPPSLRAEVLEAVWKNTVSEGLVTKMVASLASKISVDSLDDTQQSELLRGAVEFLLQEKQGTSELIDTMRLTWSGGGKRGRHMSHEDSNVSESMVKELKGRKSRSRLAQRMAGQCNTSAVVVRSALDALSEVVPRIVSIAALESAFLTGLEDEVADHIAGLMIQKFNFRYLSVAEKTELCQKTARSWVRQLQDRRRAAELQAEQLRQEMTLWNRSMRFLHGVAGQTGVSDGGRASASEEVPKEPVAAEGGGHSGGPRVPPSSGGGGGAGEPPQEPAGSESLPDPQDGIVGYLVVAAFLAVVGAATALAFAAIAGLVRWFRNHRDQMAGYLRVEVRSRPTKTSMIGQLILLMLLLGGDVLLRGVSWLVQRLKSLFLPSDGQPQTDDDELTQEHREGGFPMLVASVMTGLIFVVVFASLVRDAQRTSAYERLRRHLDGLSRLEGTHP